MIRMINSEPTVIHLLSLGKDRGTTNGSDGRTLRRAFSPKPVAHRTVKLQVSIILSKTYTVRVHKATLAHTDGDNVNIGFLLRATSRIAGRS